MTFIAISGCAPKHTETDVSAASAAHRPSAPGHWESREENIDREISELDARLKKIEAFKAEYEYANGRENYAQLTPDSKTFDTIRTPIGEIIVSMKDIKPYAGGSKITLMFGNPLSADLSSPNRLRKYLTPSALLLT